MTGSRLAYAFDTDRSDLVGEPEVVLGGKGAGLAEMSEAGLPVPPGFTLTTEACLAFLSGGWTEALQRTVLAELETLQAVTGKRLGSATSPLLVSVRSGAEVSMPGMMDTVLNVGMGPAVEGALAHLTGDAAFAADTHRRAILGFAEIVLGAPREVLANAAPGGSPAEVAATLRSDGFEMPADPVVQVEQAIRVVFESWAAPRAVRYRQVENIDDSLGTAATIQAMVFGNLGDRSGTGVAFTRNPTTGERGLMGDFLANAQGEDVVAGTSMTEPLGHLASRWPQVADELAGIAERLERTSRDMVDIEFTVEQGKLWLLQARRGKRSPIAAVRIAIDMADDPDFPVDRAEAVERCRRYLDDPPTVAAELDSVALPVAATGLAASPGQGSGILVLDPDRAVELADRGLDVVLARRETSPSDVHGIAVAKGLFTALGGLVSHAALVAREWGIPAVVGASEATMADGHLDTPAGRVEAGTVVTVDGDNGRLLIGRSAVSGAEAPEVTVIRTWAAAAPGDDAQAGHPAGPPVDSSSAAGFLALHALRIKGMAKAETVASLAGIDEVEATEHLDDLVASGAASFVEAQSMWLLSAEGREAHGPALADVVGGLDLSGLPYERFLVLNGEFKRLCTDWQLRDGEPNDHSDADYDAGIVGRLGRFHDEAGPVVAAIGASVPWMAGYGPRLAAARSRFESGDQKGLTGVMCDSYHDVWMELHEDLILTQGIDRAAEGSF